MKCVNQHRSNARVLGHRHRSFHRVLTQCRTEMQPLCLAIDRQSSQHHHGYWVRHIAPNLSERRFVCNRTGCQGMEAPYPGIGFADHKRSTSARGLIAECATLEPFIKQLFSALEQVESMRSRQRLRWLQVHGQDRAFLLAQRGSIAIRRLSPVFGVGGAFLARKENMRAPWIRTVRPEV